MKNVTCKICDEKSQLVFTGMMLKKHEAFYHSCPNCGYLFIREPYWLSEAYSDAIVDADTGLVYRNQLFSECITRYLVLLGQARATCLDLSGGTGLFTRLMRDNGFDYYWDDPYCRNIHARGFELKMLPEGYQVSVVTAFEVLEHLENPVDFIRHAFSNSHAQVLIVSTELFAGSPPALDAWNYYMPETGQHIGFFQQKTLRTIATRLKLHLDSHKHFHVFSRVALPRWPLRLAQIRPNPLQASLVRKWLGSRVVTDHREILSR